MAFASRSAKRHFGPAGLRFHDVSEMKWLTVRAELVTIGGNFVDFFLISCFLRRCFLRLEVSSTQAVRGGRGRDLRQRRETCSGEGAGTEGCGRPAGGARGVEDVQEILERSGGARRGRPSDGACGSVWVGALSGRESRYLEVQKMHPNVWVQDDFIQLKGV